MRSGKAKRPKDQKPRHSNCELGWERGTGETAALVWLRRRASIGSAFCCDVEAAPATTASTGVANDKINAT